MTDTVRVPREAVEQIADELRVISLELTKKRATTSVSEDIFRKALALEAMLAASPQGEGSSADADTHRAAAVDVVGLFDQISALCTSFNCQAHDADDVLGQINQLAYAGIAAVKPASVRTGQ